MASGQLRLFALITLVVANVSPSLSMDHNIPQVVRINPPQTVAQTWSQIDQHFFEVMRNHYDQPTDTNRACLCPSWNPLQRRTEVDGDQIRITSSPMSEEVCRLLRLGTQCDPKAATGLSNVPTSIVITGFAPIDSWGVCRPPRAKIADVSSPPDGLCYHRDHSPDEVQREISCWMKKRFPAAQLPSVIPMAGSPCNGIASCWFLIANYRQGTGHTNMMNAGGSTRTGGNAQVGISTQAGQGSQAGGSTRARGGAHTPFVQNQDRLQSMRQGFHTTATGPRSTMCPSPQAGILMAAGFQFQIPSTPPFYFSPSISCVLLGENTCAHIRRGVSCLGSDLHKADPNRKIPITITGFMLTDNNGSECKQPTLTPTTGKVPIAPNGRCCYIGDPRHMQDQAVCFRREMGSQNPQAAASKRPLGPNAPPEGSHVKRPKS